MQQRHLALVYAKLYRDRRCILHLVSRNRMTTAGEQLIPFYIFAANYASQYFHSILCCVVLCVCVYIIGIGVNWNTVAVAAVAATAARLIVHFNLHSQLANYVNVFNSLYPAHAKSNSKSIRIKNAFSANQFAIRIRWINFSSEHQ